MLGGGDVVEDLAETRIVRLIVIGGEHLTEWGVRPLRGGGALRFAARGRPAKQLRVPAKQLGVGELSCRAVQRAEGCAGVRDQEIGSRRKVGARIGKGVGDECPVLPWITRGQRPVGRDAGLRL